MVVLFHFGSAGAIAGLGIIRSGGLFVEFFFVLSGFVIGASYRDRLRNGFPVGRFMFLRMGRIYPLHIFMLTMFVLLECVGLFFSGLSPRQPFTGSRSFGALVESALLLQAFNPPQGLAWNAPSWSIAAEVWAYVAAAVVCRFLPRCVTAAMLAIVVLSAAWLMSTPQYLNHTSDWGVVTCLYGFGLGMLGWSMFKRWERLLGWLGPPLATIMETAAAVAAVVMMTTLGGIWTMAYPPMFLLVILIFSVERGWLSTLLKTRPARVLGLLSYSIYLTHSFVQGRLLDILKLSDRLIGQRWVATRPDGVKLLVAPPMASDLVTVVMLLLVVAVSAATYLLVERPAREWSRRRAGAAS